MQVCYTICLLCTCSLLLHPQATGDFNLTPGPGPTGILSSKKAYQLEEILYVLSRIHLVALKHSCEEVYKVVVPWCKNNPNA